jgi:isochorismate hydrolase
MPDGLVKEALDIRKAMRGAMADMTDEQKQKLNDMWGPEFAKNMDANLGAGEAGGAEPQAAVGASTES